jgi:hypothetical protein
VSWAVRGNDSFAKDIINPLVTFVFLLRTSSRSLAMELAIAGWGVLESFISHGVKNKAAAACPDWHKP